MGLTQIQSTEHLSSSDPSKNDPWPLSQDYKSWTLLDMAKKQNKNKKEQRYLRHYDLQYW